LIEGGFREMLSPNRLGMGSQWIFLLYGLLVLEVYVLYSNLSPLEVFTNVMFLLFCILLPPN